MSGETLAYYVWVFLISLLGLSGIVMALFYRRLRNRYPEEWQSLGSPTLILNASMKNQRRVNKFLWKGDYRRLDDRSLSRLALTAKLLGVLSALLFMFGSILVINLQ